MKRLSLLVAVVTTAGLWLGPVAPAAHALQQVRVVTDPAACIAAVNANPTFTTVDALKAFVTTGPCGTSLTTSSVALAGTIACSMPRPTPVGETPFLGLQDFYVYYDGSCSPRSGSARVVCLGVTTADGAPPVMAGAGLGTNTCSALTDVQYALAAKPVLVGVGAVIGIDSGDNVGVGTTDAIWTP